MKNLLLVITCILAFMSHAQAQAQEKSITVSHTHLFSDFFNIGYKANRDFDKGNGMLMIQFNAYQMNKQGKLKNKKAKVDDLFLINLVTKDIKEINFQHEKPLLLDLPTGRYCLGGVKLLSGRIIKYCKHVFFDVLKNHIELGGRVTMGVYETRLTKKDEVVVKEVDRSLRFIEAYVDANGVEELEKYQAKVRGQFPKSFYVYRPFGYYTVVRFLDESSAELQKFAQNQNTYYPLLSDHNRVLGQTAYKSLKEGNLFQTVDQWSGKVIEPFNSKFPWIATTEYWYAKATRHIQDINMDFNLFDQNFILVNPGLTYAKEDYEAGKSGVLNVTFQLISHSPKYGLDVAGAYKTVDIEFESNQLSNKMIDDLIDELGAMRFYVHDKSVLSEPVKAKITYQIIDGDGVVELIWDEATQ